MITKELIARINALAHKAKRVGLSEEELAEQAELRNQYLQGFKTRMRAQLDAIDVVDEDGNKRSLTDKQ